MICFVDTLMILMMSNDSYFSFCFILYFSHMRLWFIFGVSGTYRLILSSTATYFSNL